MLRNWEVFEDTPMGDIDRDTAYMVWNLGVDPGLGGLISLV